MKTSFRPRKRSRKNKEKTITVNVFMVDSVFSLFFSYFLPWGRHFLEILSGGYIFFKTLFIYANVIARKIYSAPPNWRDTKDSSVALFFQGNILFFFGGGRALFWGEAPTALDATDIWRPYEAIKKNILTPQNNLYPALSGLGWTQHMNLFGAKKRVFRIFQNTRAAVWLKALQP